MQQFVAQEAQEEKLAAYLIHIILYYAYYEEDVFNTQNDKGGQRGDIKYNNNRRGADTINLEHLNTRGIYLRRSENQMIQTVEKTNVECLRFSVSHCQKWAWTLQAQARFWYWRGRILNQKRQVVSTWTPTIITHFIFIYLKRYI